MTASREKKKRESKAYMPYGTKFKRCTDYNPRNEVCHVLTSLSQRK